LLPKGSVRKRDAPVLMAAPLSPDGARFLQHVSQPGDGDFCWVTDHI
jgi:hypothetical protein